MRAASRRTEGRRTKVRRPRELAYASLRGTATHLAYGQPTGLHVIRLSDEDAPSISDGLPSLIDVCDSKAWEMKAYEGTSSLPQRRRRSVNQ